MTDLLQLDAVGTAEAIRSGAVTAHEVAEHAIARIEEHDGALNAVSRAGSTRPWPRWTRGCRTVR